MMYDFLTSADGRKVMAALRAAPQQNYGIVYMIRNLETGKAYIGQTTQHPPWNRYLTHIKNAKSGMDHPLYRAIRKYGEGAFVYETLANCDSKKSLDSAEHDFIRLYDTLSPNGYNLHEGGAHGKFSDDLKKKLSLIHSTPDVSQKHSASMRAKWANPEFRQKIKNYWDAVRSTLPPKSIKQKRSREEITREILSRPGFLENRNAAIAASNSKPEVRERIGAGTRGGKWIFCDDKSRRLKPNETLPDGWFYGRGKNYAR